MSILLDGPRMLPRSGAKPENLVVLLHGYGANGADLIGLAAELAPYLPNAAFVALEAPDAIPGYPNGRQWFGLSSLGPAEVATGARLAASKLNAALDSELRRYGLKPADMALAGFSQGAMMALHVGLRRPEPIGAIVAFSGMLPDPQSLERDIAARPPVLLAHGEADDVVPAAMSLQAFSLLGRAGVCTRLHFTPHLPHAIGPDSLDLAGAFIRDAWAGKLAGAVPPEPLSRAPVKSDILQG